MQPTHLIILIHGLYGSPLNLAAVRDQILSLTNESCEGRQSTSSITSTITAESSSSSSARSALRTEVLVVKSNAGVHTWDGIDVGAHRVAEEVDREVERLQDCGHDVVGVSFMGYSLGGLIARYLIGILHARQPSFFARHKPLSFSTAATPHLGQLKYGTRVNAIVHTVGPQMFSRTGRQLFMLDREPDWSGRSLLEVMADPNHLFIKALRQFAKHLIVANGCNDRTVPYPSASISLTDPFADLASVQVEANQDHIIQSYRRLEEPDPESLPVNDIDVLDEDGEEVKVTIKVVKSRSVFGTAYNGRLIQRFPPFWLLPYPWPFSHILFLLMPFFIPLLLLYITGLFTYQTYRSRRRIRIHRDAGNRQPLLPPGPHNDEGLSARAASSDEHVSYDNTPNAEQLSSSLMDSLPLSIRSEVDGTSTPPLSDPLPGEKTTLLLLTPVQKQMISNLHDAMPNFERIVSWFPWAFNSHAVIICRDAVRFPWQEDGRGIVRAWAKFVVASAAQQVKNGLSPRHVISD